MQMHDGAMGTVLAAELRGDETVDDLCIRAPELVRAVHADYLTAGADVIQTNSFLVGLRDPGRRRRTLLDAAGHCAREAIDGSARAATLAATIGPHARDARDYWDELEYWLERDARVVRIETLTTREGAERALDAWREVATGADATLLVGCSVQPAAGLAACRWTAELAGQADASVHVGLNCCDGVVGLRDALELLVDVGGPDRAWVDPSAGVGTCMPPAEWAERLIELIDGLPLRAAGGCCGTTPQHLAQLREMMEN